MIHAHRMASVLLYVMMTLAIVAVLSDVLLVLSFIFPPLQIWPLGWYSTFIMPSTGSQPTSNFKNQHIRKLSHSTQHSHSRFAIPDSVAMNATFVFHVIPGAGSGIVMELMQTLRERFPKQVAHIEEMSRLSFPPIRQWMHWHRVRNSLLNVIQTTPKPCIVLIESPAFISLQIPNVYYLSLMYDPLKRLQNNYQLDHWGDDLQNLMHPNWDKKPAPSFERCILSQGKDCSYATARYFYTLWFCGFDKNPKCVNKGQIKQASILAQRTIQDFLLVGILENLHQFVKSLEIIVPAVFSGLEDIYLSDKFKDINSNFVPKRNISISSEIEAKVMFTLKEDYALFKFTKAIFLENYRKFTSTNQSVDRPIGRR